MRAFRRGARTGSAVVLGLLVACQNVTLPEVVVPTECPTAAPTAGESAEILAGATTATVETSLGTFTMDLFGDAAPIATANFVALARCGFYEGITFHRVVAGWLVQAGDPNTRENRADFEGVGTGGPGYAFGIEVPPEGLLYDPYIVAMANTGRPDSNGSQFFICLTNLDAVLGRDYTIFGRVIDGTAVVDAMGAVEVSPVTDVPVDPVVINRIEVAQPESTPQ